MENEVYLYRKQSKYSISDIDSHHKDFQSARDWDDKLVKVGNVLLTDDYKISDEEIMKLDLSEYDNELLIKSLYDMIKPITWEDID